MLAAAMPFDAPAPAAASATVCACAIFSPPPLPLPPMPLLILRHCRHFMRRDLIIAATAAAAARRFASADVSPLFSRHSFQFSPISLRRFLITLLFRHYRLSFRFDFAASFHSQPDIASAIGH
jgi:hypothetical protein